MNNPVESAEPAKNIAVSDRLLGLLYQKCEGAKTDLEHNWIYQIASVGISLGLMFGLAEPISKHFLETVGHERILYLILPAANLYLFMRFGFLSSVFNDCRVALEVLSEKYFRDEGLSTLPRVRASSYLLTPGKHRACWRCNRFADARSVQVCTRQSLTRLRPSRF
jgi:hypothetical protein